MGKNQAPKPARTRTPDSASFRDYMSSQWAPPTRPEAKRKEVADYTEARRKVFLNALAELPDNQTVVIPAGRPKQRSNDTDYPYRPHTAFTYLTGWGSDTTPGSILVVNPGDSTTPFVLYARGPAGRDSEEFYASADIGEFWTGPRPHLDDIEVALGLPVRPLESWPGVVDEELQRTVTVDDGDPLFYAELSERRRTTLTPQQIEALVDADAIVARILSEARFVKDDFEIGELRLAIDSTHRGFTDILASLGEATGHPRGERIVEGAFFARARREGNDVGYGTIAASGHHACILHWVRNDGQVTPGDLLLVDAGVERDSLYTADITRTLPVSGRFSAEQRAVYEAVLAAADAAFAEVKPGVPFRHLHDTAMAVIAETIRGWGFLPVTVEQALSKEGGQHRRYMVHGTSHHLGLDVHDCQRARRELYVDQELQPGMVFTIEPGLYFQPDDLTVPEKWRGIGVRIEDNILVTKDGAENLSVSIPRSADEVEAWVQSHLD